MTLPAQRRSSEALGRSVRLTGTVADVSAAVRAFAAQGWSTRSVVHNSDGSWHMRLLRDG